MNPTAGAGGTPAPRSLSRTQRDALIALEAGEFRYTVAGWTPTYRSTGVMHVYFHTQTIAALVNRGFATVTVGSRARPRAVIVTRAGRRAARILVLAKIAGIRRPRINRRRQ